MDELPTTMYILVLVFNQSVNANDTEYLTINSLKLDF